MFCTCPITQIKGEIIVKRFNITVNGRGYDVLVEEVPMGASAKATTAAPKQATPAPKKPTAASPAAPKAEPKAVAASGSATISAPMPGTILDIKVKEGQAVQKGEVIAILEAMKMENDIMAPQAGTIASINAKKGQSVEVGEVIATLS